jgi:hypothetical protein
LQLRNKGIKMKFPIRREKAGVISKKPVWVCSYSCYMHINETLLGLLWSVITEYKDDEYLVG